jgi:hypothetical protein
MWIDSIVIKGKLQQKTFCLKVTPFQNDRFLGCFGTPNLADMTK